MPDPIGTVPWHDSSVDTATLDRARRGDGDAFRTLTAPHERELLLHCYRMLGSLTDAEDLLQETMLAAWRGLPGFEGRSSLRTWLYRIATNRCLNALRDGRRVPPEPVPPFAVPTPSRLGEIPWLQPYADSLLDGVPAHTPGPDARYETREAVELAFITALQRMPPRQAATLILRDVLGYPAPEVATMLNTTETAVKGTLQRARAALPHTTTSPHPQPGNGPPPSISLAPSAQRPRSRARCVEDAVARRFAEAFTAGDVGAVVALLTDDAWLSMPPAPHEYHGRHAVADFLRAGMAHADGRSLTLRPTRANTQPAFNAAFPEGPAGIIVLTVAGDRIAAITRFHDIALATRFPD